MYWTAHKSNCRGAFDSLIDLRTGRGRGQSLRRGGPPRARSCRREAKPRRRVAARPGPGLGRRSRVPEGLRARRFFGATARDAPVALCVEIKILRRVLNHRVVLPRHRCDAGSSPLDGASTAAPSPRNDLVKNYRVHPTHRLISTQDWTSPTPLLSPNPCRRPFYKQHASVATPPSCACTVRKSISCGHTLTRP